MKNAFLLTLLLIAVVACQPRAQQQANTTPVGANATEWPAPGVVDVPQFQALITRPGVQLLDVRTPAEFAEGHIEGALNINVNDSDFREQIQAKLKPGQPVAVYCRSGRRSAAAAQIMTALGYQQIYDLKGGFLAWPQ